MKIRSLLIAFVVVMIVGCIYTDKAFSNSLKNELRKFNERNKKEEVVVDTPKYGLEISQISHIKDILKEERLAPWKYNFFVHSCKDGHSGPACKANGALRCISIVFVLRKDIAIEMRNFFLGSSEDHLIHTACINSLRENMHPEKKAELYFSPTTGNIVKFIVKKEKIWINVNLRKKIEI